MKHLFTFLIFIFFISCANRLTYVNKSGSCRIKLYNDSTYHLKYPTFFKNIRKNGTYKITGNSLVLKRTIKNIVYDSTDCSSIYYIDHPDTVELSFRNLNDSSINVAFTINQNSTVFKTDHSGHLKILYSDLVSKKIISSDSSFHSISISFNNTAYFISGKSMFPKPTNIDIQLNQFVGQKTVTLYRKFDYLNDTVIVNGMDPKAIGRDRKLTRR
ncbi:MAG: hypothetical protein JWP12_1113 [Bacteroidetes bacterium]|nr:hypothetical protein [Bacteroidota bacterium]